MYIYMYIYIYIYIYTYDILHVYFYNLLHTLYTALFLGHQGFLFDETSTVDRVCWEGYRQIKIQHYFYADLCILYVICLVPSSPISICQTIG